MRVAQREPDVAVPRGAEVRDRVVGEGEKVVVKQFPDAFHATDLQETLQGLGVGGDLVLAGFMTHMCVQFTAQGAFNRGYRPTVVAEATATRPLEAPDGTVLSSDALQTAALTTVSDLFGTVARTVDDLVALTPAG